MTVSAIETVGLHKSYGEKEVLRPLNLVVESGEIYGLLGHNGAGKTTTVRLLTTLLSPSGGSAFVGGIPIALAPADARHIIGYLPENVQFYDNLTLLENLLFFGKLSGLRRPLLRIQEVLHMLDFTGFEKKKLGTFSKGMRQRVGLAQAILHDPKVLFLDEPTTGLDPEGIRTLRELIISLNRDHGLTIFMNTHLLSEVTKTCTSIGILRNGELIHSDTLVNTLTKFPGQESLEQAYFSLETSEV